MARGTADDWQLSAGELEVESQPEAETVSSGAFGKFVTLLPSSENAQK
ncbi:hypothetical protein [Microcoleus vaginatus]